MSDTASIERQTYVLFPHRGLLFDKISRSRFCLPLLLVLAVSGATLLFLRFESVPFIILRHRPSLWACIAGAAALIALAVLVAVKVFEFRRIRYVFSPVGVRIEGGIGFYSDLMPWAQINDVNVSATITEQLFSCGTIIIGTRNSGSRLISFVPNFKALRDYMEKHLKRNYDNTRNVNQL